MEQSIRLASFSDVRGDRLNRGLFRHWRFRYVHRFDSISGQKSQMHQNRFAQHRLPAMDGLGRGPRTVDWIHLYTHDENIPRSPYPTRVTPLQPVPPQCRRYGGTYGGKFCSVNKNQLTAQLLARDFESNPGRKFIYFNGL